MVSKIKQAYHATRLLITIILQEVPHGHYRAISTGIRGRVRRTDNEATFGGVQTDSTGTAKPIRGQETVSDKASTCNEFLGFWAGDTLDRFHHPNDMRSGGSQELSNEDLRDESQVQQCFHPGGEWDLLEPITRQTIILDTMRSHQAKSDTFQVFTVHDVVVLCDRACVGAHWDIVFDDLVLLLRQRSVVLVPGTQGKVFLGLFWGVA